MKKTLLLSLFLFLLSQILFAQAPRPFPLGLPTCLEDDFRQLEKLYDATNGDNWKNKTGWFSANMKSWYGIYLTVNNCDVEIIALDNNALKGNLPSIDLPSLTGFYVRINQLSGSIPNFDKLPKLEKFSCNNNQLTGNIPNFDKLPTLFEFGCSNNQLTGNIPNFDKLANLEKMECSENQLSGAIPNFNLPLLVNFYCHDNQLNGTIPNFDKLPKLEIFYCRKNQLSGTIPNFDKLPLLLQFDCSNNQLTGNITNFNKLPNCYYFLCSNNQLSGSIPNFDKLPKLENFSCSNNQLSGTIPNFDKTPILSEFYCSNNQLSGVIPNFDKLSKLNRLYCDNNRLIGNLPSKNLTSLNVSNNFFNFGNLESANASNFEYYPQKTRLPIFKKEDQIIADLAGTSLNKLTYSWYLDNKLIKTTKNANQIKVNKQGHYSYTVTHATLTKALLKSDTLNIGGLVNGKIFHDSNSNCTFENNEKKFKDIAIRFENIKDTVIALADTNGIFKVALDTFNYKISLNAGSNWKVCTLPNVKFIKGSDSLFVNIPLQTIVVTSDPSQSDWKVSVCPNPVQQQAIFNIENSDDQYFILKITDGLGRVLHSQESNISRIVFDNILPQGVYFYHIENKSGHISGKLMIGL